MKNLNSVGDLGDFRGEIGILTLNHLFLLYYGYNNNNIFFIYIVIGILGGVLGEFEVLCPNRC